MTITSILRPLGRKARRGAVALEYALVLAFVAVAVLAAMNSLDRAQASSFPPETEIGLTLSQGEALGGASRYDKQRPGTADGRAAPSRTRRRWRATADMRNRPSSSPSRATRLRARCVVPTPA